MRGNGVIFEGIAAAREHRRPAATSITPRSSSPGTASATRWNSNSMLAWLTATADLLMAPLAPPPGGRAPGWAAGLEPARRGRAPASTIADMLR